MCIATHPKTGKRKYKPWKVTAERLPPVLEIRPVGSPVFDAVEFGVDERTGSRVVKRVGWIIDPLAFEEIARVGF